MCFSALSITKFSTANTRKIPLRITVSTANTSVAMKCPSFFMMDFSVQREAVPWGLYVQGALMIPK